MKTQIQVPAAGSINHRHFACLGLLLLISGCGGGGSGPGGGLIPPPPPPPPPPTNAAPSRVAISNISLNDGTRTVGGVIVGVLYADDPDAGDTIAFSIEGGADSASFTLSAGQLIIDAGVLDFAAQSQYEVIVRATDSGGLMLDQAISILVLEPQVATVGYYDLATNAGRAEQAAPINFIAATPVDVGDIAVATLAGMDMLFFQHPISSLPVGAYIDPANLAKVSDFVDDGGVLIFHSRVFAGMEDVLPGNPGTLVGDFNALLNYDVIDENSIFANGPAGIIDDTTFDGLPNLVDFGHVDSATAPVGSTGLFSRADPDLWVTYSYPVGDGYVIFSSIPLDFYLQPGSIPAVARDLYAPNIVAHGLGLLKLGPDADGDGLLDVEEAMLGTDPAASDTDADGLGDRFEVQNGFDPNAGGDGAVDTDSDGLSNLEEQTERTDPRASDSDGDSLSDGDEVNVYLSDPLATDTDSDGINDGDEVTVYSTDPILADTDSGGVDDGIEVFEDMTDPLDPTDDLAHMPLPITLNDATGFIWDIQADGSINNGSIDAYDGGLRLSVAGTPYPHSPDAVESQGGRELRLRRTVISDLDVYRRIFVSDIESFARFLEFLENPTNVPITVDVTLDTNLGSDGGTVIVTTSDGDALVENTDLYIVSDDASNGAGDPTLAHVYGDPNGSVAPLSVNAPVGNIDYTFRIDVPANDRVILMHFASQNANRAVAMTSADDLINLRGEALRGLTVEEFQDIINFDLTQATPLALDRGLNLK